MIATLFAVLPNPMVPPTAIPQGKEFEVEVQELPWEQLLRRGFDPALGLPSTRASAGRDLPAEMQRLLELRFETRDMDGRVHRNFGDLAFASRTMTPRERERWFQDLERRAPAWTRDWGQGLRELLFDDQLRRKDWDPDESMGRDGILEAEAWDLGDEGLASWSDTPNRALAEQCATLIYAGLPAIKSIENNFRLYPEFQGADYESIYPKKGQYFRGTDPEGGAFAAVGLHFRCDLPFPYSDYTCHLRILNRVVEDRVYTDIFSDSEDFHWLAGRDTYLPVETTEGEFVGMLLVRQYGFDLDGVPDKPKHRRAALRGSVGNLKLGAETVPSGSRLLGGAEASLPEFRVLGRW